MAPYSIIAQSRFFMRRTLKTLMKIRSVFPLAILLALYAHWGGPLLCLANCNRGQGSITLQPNLPRPFRPIRIICPVTAITPFWLARCIKWACISFTVLKPAPQAKFIRLTLVGHRIIAKRVSVLVCGITILVRSPGPVLPKSATRWNKMMKLRIARFKCFISSAAAKITAHGA